MDVCLRWPSSSCQHPVYSSSIPTSFLELGREREGLKKGVVNGNANHVGKILFNIQVACLPYTLSLWETNKCQRNVKLCLYLLGPQCISEEALWHLVITFFEGITQSRGHKYIKRISASPAALCTVNSPTLECVRHFVLGGLLGWMILLALKSKGGCQSCPHNQ